MKISPILKYISTFFIVLSLGLYFRLYPMTSFNLGESSEKATVYVLAQLKGKINRQVQDNYPDMPKTQKDIIIKKLFDELVHKEQDRIKETISKVSQDIGQISSDGRGYPYLLASDSYYYYGLTQHIAQTGSISDNFKGSKYFHPLMSAPDGHWEPLCLHPYIGYFVFKSLQLFIPDISLMRAVSFTPLLIMALILIAFLLLCSLLEISSMAVFSGSIFFILAPIFVKRSMFAWYDNDPYNVLFPLLVLCLFFYGIKHLINIRRAALCAGLTMLMFIIYSMFWQGWVLTFAIIGVSSLLIGAHHLFFVKDRKIVKNLLITFSIIILGSFLGISLNFGKDEFFVLFQEGWTALREFLTPQLSPWPDMYIGVGELRKAPWPLLIEQLGGILFFVMAIFGFVYSWFTNLRSTQKLYRAITLSVFGGVGLFLSLGAQRFVLLCLIPMALFFCLGTNAVIEIIRQSLSLYIKERTSSKKIILSMVYLIIAFSALIPIHNIHGSLRNLLNPIFNKTWEDALITIQEKTPSDSIITAWWPPGHFIKSVARRRVTFDGATINVPQAYWVANIFLSTSEEEALGILRMLNNSGNKAVERLQQLGFDLPTSVLMLSDITHRDYSEARELLFKVLKNYKTTNELLDMTHSRPAPSYLLIYNEFVENNIQLKFVGHWNFKKIHEINHAPPLLKKVPPGGSEEFIDFLWTLAGGPYRYSGPLASISRSGDVTLFQENVTADTVKMFAWVKSEKYGKGIPHSLFYVDQDKVIEKKLIGSDLSYSVLLYKKDGRLAAVLLDRELAQSLLVRLYFFEGTGLKYIKPLTRESDLTGRTQISVFEVDWEKFNN